MEEFIERAGELIEKFKKKSWKPIVKDEDSSVFTSKFSGIPYLFPEESWPSCPECKRELQLFLQLNLNELPQEAENFGNGLVQFFFCTKCHPFGPSEEASVVRLIEPEKEWKQCDIPYEEYFPAKIITGWKEIYDYPHPQDFMELCEKDGITFDEDEEEILYETELPEPQAGEKLGGWPCWILEPSYSLCPVCKKRMKMMFQIDSNHNIPFMFKNMGCGHITKCDTHKDQLAFNWTC